MIPHKTYTIIEYNLLPSQFSWFCLKESRLSVMQGGLIPLAVQKHFRKYAKRLALNSVLLLSLVMISCLRCDNFFLLLLYRSLIEFWEINAWNTHWRTCLYFIYLCTYACILIDTHVDTFFINLLYWSILKKYRFRLLA